MAGLDELSVSIEAARPLAYFFHDSDAAMDAKIRRLVKRLGVEGYGRWWLLCEFLAREDSHSVDVREDYGWELLADGLMCGAATAREFVEECVKLGLLDRESYAERGKVVNDRIMRSAQKVGRRRAAGKLGAKRRWTDAD